MDGQKEDNRTRAREISGFRVRPGDHTSCGAQVRPGGINFTIASVEATGCELLLFRRHRNVPFAVIPIPEDYRIGGVYAIFVEGLAPEEFEYAYRIDGPFDPHTGEFFEPERILLDPYAKAVAGQRPWGAAKRTGDYHARVVREDYDWGDTSFPRIPLEDSLIYEMHVRGFTRHRSSNVEHPGTFRGLAEKIPYLKDLGVTAVELMPIFEFDETINARTHGGKLLLEYWGYNTVAFFAPNSSFTAQEEHSREGDELKDTIRLLKENGIEVILDVVFNHTAEGNRTGPFYSFKGIDNRSFYILTPSGDYFNFSGCGNTVNCNHPMVRRFILDCLRYWVSRFHVDGFRFDLASILTRDSNGAPMELPPLLEEMVNDPVLRGCKLIAEPWDAGGLYQVGTFPSFDRFSEWNGRYRDAVRDYLKGNYWNAPEMAARLTGSGDLYHGGSRNRASINFVTCHDGFTLNDLFSYDHKHNESNGWNNTDGADDNRSWNCGVEGPADDPVIRQLRRKMMRSAITVLMCSRGTPMILAGDEFCNTQFGNNNAYCQDNETSWLNWDYLKINAEFYSFYKSVIHFRKAHPAIRKPLPPARCGLPSISLCGADPDDHVVTRANMVLGVLYAGRLTEENRDDVVYMVINAYWEPREIRLPALPEGFSWGLAIDTDAMDGEYYREEPEFLPRPIYLLRERSTAVFTLYHQPS
ncbi:MAG: glycogen debranching protein GlgX [Lachnospiraceae bacterium]|nr:glycogen debranching protein GlgX [Lachnospiraceae bacterium]